MLLVLISLCLFFIYIFIVAYGTPIPWILLIIFILMAIHIKYASAKIKREAAVFFEKNIPAKNEEEFMAQFGPEKYIALKLCQFWGENYNVNYLKMKPNDKIIDLIYSGYRDTSRTLIGPYSAVLSRQEILAARSIRQLAIKIYKKCEV
ncbi:hypothetical protein [Aquitalea sp. ASV11]|uniref:hypothetical protein n=1 Tax=Aquitalea sp. ASV11 TaxID=2795103 RepID=UPI0018EC8CC8|nr:hypothetical protein [Aquitalea sp. ASV11]